LYPFDFSWSKLANVLYLESPVGVGFTYADNDGDYDNTDDTTAADNMASVEKFFELFPEYQANPFYITGESYGGIYVPTLAEAILLATLDDTYTGAPLKGIAVGNGCAGTEIGICSEHLGTGGKTTFIEQYFVQSTAFLSQSLKAKQNANCNWEDPYEVSAECREASLEMSRQLYQINIYDIYGQCINGDEDATNSYRTTKTGIQPIHDEGFGPSWCIDSIAASKYFNQDDVIEAIHVQKQNFSWSVCGQDPRFTYSYTRPNLPRDTYPFLNENINVIIYNGDWDACVPYNDNDKWTRDMGYEVAEDWHEWFYSNPEAIREQVGGYATRYETANNFTFITIRGGRHEVPETAPAASFEMIRRMVMGEQF